MADGLNSTGDWTVQPQAEALLQEALADSLSRSPQAEAFRRRLLDGAGVRLRDILDHLTFAEPGFPERLQACGWRREAAGLWRHPLGYFPDFLEAGGLAVAFRCESAFTLAQAIGASPEAIEGVPQGPHRRLRAFAGDGVAWLGVERTGWAGYDLPQPPPAQVRAARIHLQAFRTRRRQFDDVSQGFDHLDRLVDAAVAELGAHWSCALFFQAEREYWMSRCDAGRLQKARQDAVGIGWANLDHHTFDSSREWFPRAIRVLETLGYECREMFYAGAEAGWGSQILEQPALRSTIFADIDLAPEELDVDFAHVALPPLSRHRRAGLWCAMHGQSMLEAGLNHVAGMYDQAALRAQLDRAGVRMMAPFSAFPHLYQELTEGQWWAVAPERIDRLQAQGHLDAQEAEEFRLNGAIAAHLENLERNQGFKGFNQPGIDGVLRIIDPRSNMLGAEAAAG